MRSRALAISSRWLLDTTRTRLPSWTRATTTSSSRPPGDTALRWGDSQREAADAAMAEEQLQRWNSGKKSTKTHYASSPKLENWSVNPPSGPIHQQKRHYNNPTAAAASFLDVPCVGFDGTLVNDKQYMRGEKKEEEEDYETYYRERKPSPLSELVYVDTRVPLRRATDSTVDLYAEYGGGEVVLWREEQLDTAEQALLRAEAMFQEAKERGDPETPWGRVLAAARRDEGWSM